MRSLIVAACVAVCLSGCGSKPKVAPVTGKVLHNGKPLTAGSIWLHPASGNDWTGEKPGSVLQLDGSFTIRTYPHGLGVPPGSYKVTLSPELASRVRKPELGDPARTPWALEVPDEGVSDRVFEVK